MALFMKNTDGKPSVSLTMAFIGFFIITAWLLFWIIGVTFGLAVPAFDETAALAYLTPLLGLYFGRKGQDASPKAPAAQNGSAEQSAQPTVAASEPSSTEEQAIEP